MALQQSGEHAYEVATAYCLLHEHHLFNNKTMLSVLTAAKDAIQFADHLIKTKLTEQPTHHSALKLACEIRFLGIAGNKYHFFDKNKQLKKQNTYQNSLLQGHASLNVANTSDVLIPVLRLLGG